ncbi:alpha/beta hydrolase [Natronosporangium hydrolyticum]|uniref:Alpha/beta hydrolase n=1 Tax=Natronosporangium hydrolyticum TaxID=2811111 RepID=A0A895YGS1_9ACTN|nr:alpha/beta hydrolase [Natronosporangium hydrolyticum]QSB14709.1 alpha/beta hydrolase [Natronosporangium hydrolyticum]
MNRTQATGPARTSTLEVPGATLHYEVRGEGPLLAMVGAPMDARAFAPLADLLAADHTVVTTDPRGIHRSIVADPAQDSTPELRADDLARLLTHLDVGPAAVFGSSGGAVTALAMAQSHPGLVDTVVAHEPPLDELLEDPAASHARTEQIIATYLAGDVPGAWRMFLHQAGIWLPDEVFQAAFGSPRDRQQAADEHFWFARELRHTTRWRPDLDTLRSGPVRVVVGIGVDSAGQLCDRTSRALATALAVAPVSFPGDHTGFVDDPAGFADRLREAL